MKEWIGRFWRGEAGLARTFWEYTAGYGSLLHLMATGVAYGLYVAEFPLWLAALVFFIGLPYTVLATVGVWRAADRYQGSEMWASGARLCVVLWAIAVTVL
jgi:hypothetical protein